jgi:outer membrane protein TolC
MALINNYSIEIARSQQEIAENNLSLGNAGFLPQLKANASNQWSENNVKQELSNGSITDKTGVTGNSLNASMGFSWTLFDGSKMFVNRQKFNQQFQLSEITFKQTAEELIYKIMYQYYSIIKQKQQIKVSEQLIDLYQKRKEIAQLKKQSGAASEVDFLQAGVDLNAQQSNLLKQQFVLENQRNQLTRLISKNFSIIFDASENQYNSIDIKIGLLKEKMLTQNVQLSIAETNKNLAKLSISDYKTNIFPKLGFGMNYNFVRSENGAGFILMNQQNGINYGFTASWTLFDGLNNNRNIQNAKINRSISVAAYNDVRMQTEMQFLNYIKQYENSLKINNLEKESSKSAAFNLEISLEKYKLGSISDVVLKDAQRSYEEAQLRLINARFDQAISEIDLLKIAGELVK